MQHPNTSANDVKKRAQFFDLIANDLINGGLFPASQFAYRGNRIPLLADGYFLLSEAYKRWRINPSHRTQVPKIAAITAIAIRRFEPFIPHNPTAVKSFVELKCNEIFAFICVMAILDNPVGIKGAFNKDITHRIIDIMSASACQTLEPFVVDINMQTVAGSYTLTVHDQDKVILDSLITIFEMLHKQFSLAGILSTL